VTERACCPPPVCRLACSLLINNAGRFLDEALSYSKEESVQ
jgi:hypothetical protein